MKKLLVIILLLAGSYVDAQKFTITELCDIRRKGQSHFEEQVLNKDYRFDSVEKNMNLIINRHQNY